MKQSFKKQRIPVLDIFFLLIKRSLIKKIDFHSFKLNQGIVTGGWPDQVFPVSSVLQALKCLAN